MRILAAVASMAAWLAACPGVAAETGYCQPAAEVQAAVETLAFQDRRLPFEARVASLRSLLERFPEDLFVHMAYQDQFRLITWRLEETDRAQAIYDGMKDRVLAKYLTARLISAREPKRAAMLYLELIRDHPEFPWPHFGIAEIAAAPQTGNLPVALRHMREFAQACPHAPERFYLVAHLTSRRELEQARDELRKLLSRLPLPARLWPYYIRLWAVERSLAGEDQSALRAVVEGDLRRLELHPPLNSRAWLDTIYAGFNLIGDAGGIARLEAVVNRRFPRSDLAFQLALRRWSAENPAPQASIQEREQALYLAKLFTAAGEWLKTWPDHPEALMARWTSYVRFPVTVKSDTRELVRIAKQLTAEHPDLFFSIPPAETMMAALMFRDGLVSQESVTLLEQGWRRFEQQTHGSEQWENPGPQVTSEYWTRTRKQTVETLAESLAALGRFSEARQVLPLLAAQIAAERPAPGLALRSELLAFDERIARFLHLCATVEEKAGNRSQATQFYQAMGRKLGKDALNSPSRQKLVGQARAFYESAGGARGDFERWFLGSPGENDVSFPPRFAPLEPSSAWTATSLDGKSYSALGLQGRPVAMLVWSIRSRRLDAVLRALESARRAVEEAGGSVFAIAAGGDPPEAVERLLKEKNFTWPVVVSEAAARSYFPIVMTPALWLLDAQGRRSPLPLELDSPNWADTLVAEVRKLAAPPAGQLD